MNIEEQIWTGDPVLVAVGLFRGTEDNRRLWGWYCRQLGREAFRQLVYQKWRENETDGASRWGTGTSGATGRFSLRRTSCANSSPPTAAAARAGVIKYLTQRTRRTQREGSLSGINRVENVEETPMSNKGLR